MHPVLREELAGHQQMPPLPQRRAIGEGAFIVLAVPTRGDAPLATAAEPGKFGIKDEIGDTGHRVGAIGRGGPAGNGFDAAAWPVQGMLRHYRHEFEYMIEHGGRSIVEGVENEAA